MLEAARREGFPTSTVARRTRAWRRPSKTHIASEELQRAYALYVEIGATGHAERLARELGA